ncbi:PREDICTED: uncharacterized protein LOC108361392 [Rhagoletis zephyria]|uniref:uncharacterized protein LOC108361392 n=1 Tax=Rhagoletis zephyria TaxID=28612 RepID=UPI000811964F|nr:PREDICTED: uncharacterized protein LOC108361392 [Rhagoletis zephyria]
MSDNSLLFGENVSLTMNDAGQHIVLEATPVEIGGNGEIITQSAQYEILSGNLEQIVETQSGGDQRLKDLLKEMNIEAAYDKFYASGITFDRLKYINCDDLALVFPGNENIGYRAELREKIRLWKHNNFPEESVSTLSMNSNIKNWIENQPLDSPATNSTSSEVTSVIDMVKNSKSGQSLLSLYQTKQKLDAGDRKRLLNIIVVNFFDLNSKKYKIPRPHEMNKLAEEIVAIFPTENKEIYYISRKDARRTNASGILYNRFNNLNRKRIRLDSNTSEEQNASERETLCSTNYISFKNKMYFMSGDESDAINLWSETYKYRVNHIRDLKDLTSILEEWPFYKQATGPKFLDFDFQKMYPDENFHLINNWTDMRNQLGQLYKDLLRDKQYVDLFGSVSNECVNDSSQRATTCTNPIVFNPSAATQIAWQNVSIATAKAAEVQQQPPKPQQ